jgi:hypothetical protein
MGRQVAGSHLTVSPLGSDHALVSEDESMLSSVGMASVFKPGSQLNC